MELAAIDRADGVRSLPADLRQREFARLDAADQVYLDYTGAALYPASLVRDHAHTLMRSVLGNPHSVNPASAEASCRIHAARARVLKFFNADPALYQVIFTFNASAAIKLVAESFPFADTSELLMTADNHNSVNGIREYAARRGATVTYVPMDAGLGMRTMDAVLDARPITRGPSLFAYPAQSNFSGIQHGLEYVEQAQQRGYRVLLDAAAFVPGSRLDLRQVQPDFLDVSFYKMFGYPTGIGALIARKDALAVLQRPWFAGGTVDFASTQHPIHQLAPDEDAFEDGTPSFASADAVVAGLDFLDRVGMERVCAHTSSLGRALTAGLRGLRHGNGAPMARFYGGADQRYGGARAINLLRRDGSIIPYQQVEEAAGRAGISIRGGCFCNPGCAEAAFRFQPELVRRCLERVAVRFSPERLASCLGQSAVGAVRVSMGIANRIEDVDRFAEFVERMAQQ